MIGLVDYLRKQDRLRDWSACYKLLPPMVGKTVIDFGCGIGQQVRDFARAGAKVWGIDRDSTVLDYAKSQQAPQPQQPIPDLPGPAPITFESIFSSKKKPTPTSSEGSIKFVCGDVLKLDYSTLPRPDLIWCSFLPASLLNFRDCLLQWLAMLKPGGYLVLVEASHLLGHVPMDERARAQVENFYRHMLEQHGQDFMMAMQLGHFVRQAGMETIFDQQLFDKELSFSGPAPSAVLDAWKMRLEMMTELRQFCGKDYEAFRHRLMASLLAEEHRSLTQVHMVCARKPITASGGLR